MFKIKVKMTWQMIETLDVVRWEIEHKLKKNRPYVDVSPATRRFIWNLLGIVLERAVIAALT